MDERHERAAMIRASAAGIADRSDLRRARGLRYSELGFDRATWREMCGLGWLGLRLPESAGGTGLGTFEACALAETLGAALVPEPLVSAALAVRVLAADARAAALAGDQLVLAAWQEPGVPYFAPPKTVYRDGALHGRKAFVAAARGAGAFVVTASEGVFLVAAGAPGASLTAVPTQDGGHLGTLVLDGAPAVRVAARDEDWQAALDEASLTTAAYLLGLMDAALARTVEYLHTRKQFGVAIGSFQSLQHRAVDVKLQIELTRASVHEAASILDRGAAAPARAAAVSRAKARASEAALFVTRQAVQLHGGVGYTDEHDIGLYLRKAMVVGPSCGMASAHRARWAELNLEAEAAE